MQRFAEIRANIKTAFAVLLPWLNYGPAGVAFCRPRLRPNPGLPQPGIMVKVREINPFYCPTIQVSEISIIYPDYCHG